MQKYVFPLLVSEPPHNSTQGRLPCSLPVVTAFADITCHHISGEVVVNRFPQRRVHLAHKIIQDIAARNPPRTALATISSFHCPYPISHRTLRRPAALPCYTGPSYEGSRSEPANQPRSCDTPQPHFQTEDIILCSTRSILIIAYFYVNCVKVEENH